MITCNHKRAHQFFSENFANAGDCQPIAYRCESQTLFEQGGCADCGPDEQDCRLIGYFGQKVRPRSAIVRPIATKSSLFFLDTGNQLPYCGQCYVYAGGGLCF